MKNIRRKTAWMGLIIIALILYFFENNTGTRTVLAMTVCLPMVSLLLAAISRKNMTVNISVPKHGQKNMIFMIQLRHGKPLPFSAARFVVNVENCLTGESQMFSVESSGFEDFIEYKSAKCGLIQISVSEILLEDAFGIFSLKVDRITGDVKRTIILPEIHDIHAEVSSGAAMAADSDKWSALKAGNDPGETFGYREYLPGDPIRQINWKLSEKAETTMVRELGLPIDEECILILDNCNKPGAEKMNLLPECVEAMLSVGNSLVTEGIGFHASWVDAETELLCIYNIQTEQDIQELRERIMSISGKNCSGDIISVFRNTFFGRSFAHTVIVSQAIPEAYDELSAGGRLTLVIAEEGGEYVKNNAVNLSDRIYTFTNIEKELGYMVI